MMAVENTLKLVFCKAIAVFDMYHYGAKHATILHCTFTRKCANVSYCATESAYCNNSDYSILRASGVHAHYRNNLHTRIGADTIKFHDH